MLNEITSTEQCNLRVRPQHKGMLKAIAVRLKSDPAFAGKLEKLLSDERPDTSSFETDMKNMAIRLSRVEATLSIRAPSDEQTTQSRGMPEPLAPSEMESPGEIIGTHW